MNVRNSSRRDRLSIRARGWWPALLSAFALVVALGSVEAARPFDGPVPDRGEQVLASGLEMRSRPAPVELVAVADHLDAGGLQPMAPNQAELIDELDFEDPQFPPEGWEVDDQLTIATQPDPVNTWSRQICNTEANVGGQAAAWVAGGGSEGENLSCGQNIGKPTSTRLYLDGIDTTTYPFGVQVDFRLWLDIPQGSESFNVCWRESGATQVGDCFYINPNANQQRRWLGLQNPLQFPGAGSKASIEVMFWFNDRNGSGNYAGGFVDNVRVEALTEAPPPTATSAVSPTTPPTVPVTPPTPTITPTPTERAKIAFLPMLLANADKDDPSQMPSQYVDIWFGTAIDPADRVQNIGQQFQYGAMRLCAQVNWFGWPDATRVRWEWAQKSGNRFESIQSGTLNDFITVGQEQRPYATRCIRAVDEQGNDVPIWANEYRVQVFVDDAAEPAASKIAEITQDVPPNATALPASPTPWPTGEPSPTPQPDPTNDPPFDPGCTQVIENGDFERGPSVGWSLATNVQPPNNTLSRVIVRASDLQLVADEGDWLAVGGRAVNVRDQLISTAFDFPEASDIVSATLDFAFGIITEEVKDGVADDLFVAGLVPASGGDAVGIPGSAYSEELIESNSWYRLSQPIDVTALVTARAGWTGGQLLFESRNDAEAASAHLLDSVELQICVGDAAQRAGSLRLDSGRNPRLLSVEPAGMIEAEKIREIGPFEHARGILR